MVFSIHFCFFNVLILSHRIPRKRIPGLGPSELSQALPQKVPVDYFSPEFFNNLSVRERAGYAKNGVALPTAEFCQSLEDVEKWKTLETEEFMARYGNAKLALYKLPTAAELARFKDDN